MKRAISRNPVSELVENGLADDDRTCGAQSRDAGGIGFATRPWKRADPDVVICSATSMMSLIATGIPWSGPRSAPVVNS